MTDTAQTRAAATYNAAADCFDHPVNTFWDRFGRNTINRLDLKPGLRVLDVCCGSGASALPAAEQVGSTGQVIGIDLAENLLNLSISKASNQGLGNVEFQLGDMLDTDFADNSFDAVVCVFGIFFVPDMPAAVRELWRVLRPGGKLAITTWGQDFFEPVNAVFWNSVREVRPDLYKGFSAWDRITEPSTLMAMLNEGDALEATIVLEFGTHPITSPEDWWTMVLGSGYRGTVEQLEPEELARVRRANVEFITNAKIQAVQANVLYAVAQKI
ncbi:MAG: class I SAM-dependent methyltransferase [Methylococcaceae bacterium]|nr:class I SAM-dependent methyltransferase [Methylococcaceae bacterium]